jgi:hypothetical protein
VNVADGLEPMLVDVDDLHELPGNPRRGDVEAVKRSYTAFGQRKPIVARHDDTGRAVVVAGNHQLKAVRELGWEQVAVVWADDLTEDEARAFALADNRVADLGGYDDELLLKYLSTVDDLTATGYTDDDVADLEALLAYGATFDGSGAGTATLADPVTSGMSDYAARPTRAVILDYDIEMYEQVSELMIAARKRADVDDNAHAVLASLKAYVD